MYCLSHSAVQAMLTLTAPQGGPLAGATICEVQSSSEVRESWTAAGVLSWEQPSRPLRLLEQSVLTGGSLWQQA